MNTHVSGVAAFHTGLPKWSTHVIWNNPVPKRKTTATLPGTDIARTILILRRQRVVLDADLAALYGVTTKRQNEQVKRNAARFPADFLFRLSAAETTALNRSHSATGSLKHRDPRFPPFAFTEHGAIMAATVLNSHRAEARIDKKLTSHDEAITAMLSAIRALMNPPMPRRRRIGFTADHSGRE
ncbi:MAG: ORF6N domain-containing protein [Steroidobacteraceae bacterium]